MIKTKIEKINLGNSEYTLEVVANIDELLEDVVTDDDIPFWAEIWPAALGLSDALSSFRFSGEELLELGAGLGLPGIVASSKGAMVTQSDFVPHALTQARRNSELNGINNIKYALLDWRMPESLGQFTYIVGSDILYEPNLYSDLGRIIQMNIAPQGEIIISDPGRGCAKDFMSMMEEQGWSWKVEKISIVYQSRRSNIFIYRLRKINSPLEGN